MIDDTELSAEEIWRGYRPRANGENCIKELKDGYGWDQLNVRSFWGTEAVMLLLLLGVVCYNLMHYLKRRVLKRARGWAGAAEDAAVVGAGDRCAVWRRWTSAGVEAWGCRLAFGDQDSVLVGAY